MATLASKLRIKRIEITNKKKDSSAISIPATDSQTKMSPSHGDSRVEITNKKKDSSAISIPATDSQTKMSEAVSDAEALQKIRPRIAVRSKEILCKRAVGIANNTGELERFIFKATHLLGVLGFGAFCFILGARPQDVPCAYCLFYATFIPLRWIYYRYKKLHYYLLDFCYYANTFFLVMLLFFPKNEKLFMVCFSFAEGPLAWALIVWRCSLVFSSLDKIVSALIHLLPGVVFFTIRWWNPQTFSAAHPHGVAARASWPDAEDKSDLWIWLFLVPLVVYAFWQLLYFLIVDVLQRQTLLQDPEIMTSYRELSKRAKRENNIWWRLSGLLGDQNRPIMYILIQAVFTVVTMALTVPLFLSYEMHAVFQIFKVSATVWFGASFLLDAMPRQVVAKDPKEKAEMKPASDQQRGETAVGLSTNHCTTSDERNNS